MDVEQLSPQSDQPAARPAPRPMRISAFFASLAILGLGHALCGRPLRGLAWWGASMTCVVLCFSLALLRAPVPWLFAIVVLNGVVSLAGIIDAVRLAGRPAWQWGRWWSRGLAVSAGIAASVLWVLLVFSPGVRQFVAGYKAAANSMLPTIAGAHREVVCPNCKANALVELDAESITSKTLALSASEWISGICAHCGVVLDDTIYQQGPALPCEADSILRRTGATPTRWDIVTFHPPREPDAEYMMRLVGLPGETIELVNGKLTVDGHVCDAPDDLQFLQYFDLPKFMPGWGQQGKPAKLGPDEFFVLGDMSARSLDSRAWDHGFAGHQPFAVPRGSLTGVVTHIYWPPSRWRVFPVRTND